MDGLAPLSGKSAQSALARVVTGTAILLAGTSAYRAQDCPPPDQFANLEYTSDCGTKTYTLGYYAQDMGEQILGQYTVDGACYDYRDCNCEYHDGYTAGSIQANEPEVIGDGYAISWFAINYVEYQYDSCSYGSCEKTGVIASPVTYYDNDIFYRQVWCPDV